MYVEVVANREMTGHRPSVADSPWAVALNAVASWYLVNGENETSATDLAEAVIVSCALREPNATPSRALELALDEAQRISGE